MKKLLVLFLGFTFSTTVLFATNEKPLVEAKKELQTAVIKLLGNNQFPLTSAVAEAEVFMLLNTNNELVIISVKSKNQQLKQYIKRKLNYKKVPVKALTKMKVYRMPIKIIQS